MAHFACAAIQPKQYEIVHDNLMWAIAEVLGDAVTPDVAAAWDEVYWLMAYTLIHVERGVYSARGVRPQTVWRKWEVEKKIQETYDVVTFALKRIDHRIVKPSLPGQYITVAEHGRQKLRYGRMDVHRTQETLTLAVDQSLHEALRLALLECPAHVLHAGACGKHIRRAFDLRSTTGHCE